jgi:hypothetical protein
MDEPSMGPPPTIPMTGIAIPGGLPSTSAPASDDPLAALMAPPPRPGFGGIPSMSSDPLAALMAPPPRSVGFAPPSLSMNGASSAAPPPTFQMWLPPVSANAQQSVPSSAPSVFEPSLVQPSVDANAFPLSAQPLVDYSNLSSAAIFTTHEQPTMISEPSLAARPADQTTDNNNYDSI